ncbi:pyridoxal phosphate-dependent aminotransferase [Nocardiopsis dassonvillei]|uniref:pyridoxal phosphate-dependent aminotransferase n=1 Tax=Nocardiopsis dassonvillei TaxID=2014 RepID=UPI0033E2C23E
MEGEILSLGKNSSPHLHLPSELSSFKAFPHMLDPVNQIRMGLSENPLGCSPKAIDAIFKQLNSAHRYPDASGTSLVEKIADYTGLKRENVIVGNGIDELLLFIALTFLGRNGAAAVSDSTYSGHAGAVVAVKASGVYVPLSQDAGKYFVDVASMAKCLIDNDVVFLCNPHNPTGTAIDREQLDELVTAAERGGSLLVVDEAYMEFAEPDLSISAIEHVRADRPVIVLRTFSKAYGLAGLRCGYALAPAIYTEQLYRIKNVTVYNVNRYALAAAEASLEDLDFLESVTRHNRKVMQDFLDEITEFPWLDSYLSAANFLFCRLPWPADYISKELQNQGVLVRSCSDLGFPYHLRISVGTRDEMVRLKDALSVTAKNFMAAGDIL